MVCDRCISTLRNALEGIGYEIESVRLGESAISETPKEDELRDIADKICKNGFELIHKTSSP